ncbi:hypothetical protein SUDANB108_02671 [Streptomyces sp. enrichment culture]|uniref:hypothetical protein n=1 Tax=Streptomyces sp. enrichment culture TaxID=1795815 RepID=UPI003F576BF7
MDGRAGRGDRRRGACAAGAFGAVVAGPQQLFDSGVGWDVPLGMLVGAAAGGVFGFAFPTVLSRRRRERPGVPPPPHPPGPPPPLPPGRRP